MIVLTRPADLQAALGRASVELLGQAVPPEGAADAFIAGFHAHERANQEAAARGESSYRSDPYAQALEFLRTYYAVEVQAYAVLRNSQCLENVINGEEC